ARGAMLVRAMDRGRSEEMMRSIFASAIAVAALCGFVASCSSGDDQGPSLSLADLQDPQKCQTCHPDHFKEWSGSMHAYASDDPVFLAMNKRGQRETSGMLGDFCAKCHAPLALALGATKDGTDL